MAFKRGHILSSSLLLYVT